MTIKAVDLFCGVGGLTYGLQKAGIPVVAGIDIDDSCEYAYTHNNNCTFIHKSVEDVTGKEIRALLRGADVKILVGCAPCQPFSSHQKDKQNRSKHKDWKLLYQFGRLVEETRPHIVSMENVPELEKDMYIRAAVKILKAIDKTRANWGTDCDSIVLNCTGAYHSPDHHFTMVYADFYFIEAVLKLRGNDYFMW